MLKKLRIKFIVTTMFILTVLLCTVFGMLYHFTQSNLENESISAMKAIAERPIPGKPNDRKEESPIPYFAVQLGNHGEILLASGTYNISDTEDFSELVKAVLESRERTAELDAYGLRYYQTESPFGRNVVFMDISGEQATLNSLVKTFASVGVLSFLVFLGVSILLARWAVAPVEKVWKQQQQFVSDASHELKTPLTVIMANAELLENTEDAESKRQYTGNILTMSRQMRRLLEQMLELARSDNQQQSAPFGATDLSQVVSDSILPFEPVFFEKGLALECEIDPDIRVMGVEGQLKQVVDILLDNAQKYATGTTWVRLGMTGRNRCTLCVANQGDAIAKEHLENLFKRFYRQDEARSRDGSFGLGLSIAEDIVTRHKGKIRAESKDGINAFLVELPTV